MNYNNSSTYSYSDKTPPHFSSGPCLSSLVYLIYFIWNLTLTRCRHLLSLSLSLSTTGLDVLPS